MKRKKKKKNNCLCIINKKHYYNLCELKLKGWFLLGVVALVSGGRYGHRAFRFIVVTVGDDKVGPVVCRQNRRSERCRKVRGLRGWDWDYFVWGRRRWLEPSSFCATFLNFTSCLLQITEMSSFVTFFEQSSRFSFYLALALVVVVILVQGAVRKDSIYSCQVPGINATCCSHQASRLHFTVNSYICAV